MRLVDLARAEPACGGKAYALGRLMRAGVPVPEGVVVLGRVNPAELAAELGHRAGLYAVRSSGVHEDSADLSFAGQLETVLGVDAQAAGDAVELCSRSAGGERVRAYAARLGAVADGAVPVIVQRLVAADVAGVAFSRDPTTGEEAVVIESAYGLGESVAGAAVVPDRHRVPWPAAGDDAGADRPDPPAGQMAAASIEVTVGSKATRLDAGPRGLRRTAVSMPGRRRPALTDAQVRLVARAARRAATVMGHPVDLEWAIERDTLWVLQARPVTAGLQAWLRLGEVDPTEPRPLVTGTGCSPGRVTGPARVVRGLDELGRVEPGDVLVCRTTDPAWTPLFHVVAAVVSETGGVLSHAAIVAREVGVPAVVGAVDARSRITDGQVVVVDGTRGTVAAASRPA